MQCHKKLSHPFKKANINTITLLAEKTHKTRHLPGRDSSSFHLDLQFTVRTVSDE